MIVLSLFDGMGCGYEALKRAGIKVDKYYASEIDKHAIKIAKKNHPDIIHLGDVELWKTWKIEKPDLIIGGSPCQGFSFAGVQLNFDDPRSKLFFTMNDIIEHYDPKYKLLENVRMGKQQLNIITSYMGCGEPMLINSALVSAQNRQRYYWFNWEVEQPEDRQIELSDILEPDLPSCGIGAAIRGRYIDNNGTTAQFLEYRKDKKANALTTVHKDSVVPYFKTDKKLKIKRKQNKASCLTGGAHSGGNHSDMDILVISEDIVRRYSPIECERLQTLPDNYTEGVSPSQRYKMLGNGWTVDVVAHILGGINDE